MMRISYTDEGLEQALCDIANKKPGWEKQAPSVCARAMHRLNDLENAWSVMREKVQEMQNVVNDPDDSGWR